MIIVMIEIMTKMVIMMHIAVEVDLSLKFSKAKSKCHGRSAVPKVQITDF